jgi:hypothetical protein
VTRRNLRPPKLAPHNAPGQRRGLGGARRQASDKVLLLAPGFTAEGWTLNLSRGGVRLIVEQSLELGATYALTIGDPDSKPARPGKVVWVQDEADGQICGIKFLDSEEPAPDPPDKQP